MLRVTVSKNAAGATAYFNKELSRGDYYAGKGEVAGQWHGKAAEFLGLEGEVTREAFAALASNHHPDTGAQLTPRQKQDRRAGYDFTFSAPKSVSAFYEYLHGTGRREQAEALLSAFQGAVELTMAEVEGAMDVRVRARGANSNRPSGNLVWAGFTHFQARPMEGFADPHLHTHAFVMNLTHDGEGWKAGQFGGIKTDATYYQEAFHARLGAALNALGYGVEAQATGMQLAGVARGTVQKFSRRTAEVEREAAAKGITYAEDKARQGAATRRNKDEGVGPEANRAWFMAQLSGAEVVAFERLANGGAVPPGGGMTPNAALDHALKHSFERESAIPEKRLLAEALKVGLGSVLPEQLADAAAKRTDIVRGDKGMVTTREVLAEEREMLAFAHKGRAQHVPFAGFQQARGGLECTAAAAYRCTREWLSPEQQAAVRHILGSTDRVIGVRGGAGTGKTAMMQEAVEAIAAVSGKQAVVLAPSSEASRGVLRAEGFAEADTVARFLQDRAMQAKAKDGVIFVDEAGLLGSKDMRALFRVAEDQNARVVLQGDVRQHASVARGDALRLLERKGGVAFAELTTIRRQEPKAYREAVAELAKGDVAKGFAALEAMGAVREADANTLHAEIAGAYLGHTERGESALVVAPTHAEGAKVTTLIRDGLKARGELGDGRSVPQLVAAHRTEAERALATSYAAGEVVVFHQNAKGFARGERATVLAIKGGEVSVWSETARAVKTLPLASAKQFQVFEQRELEIAAGDVVRLTQNGWDARGGRLSNGAAYHVEGFSKGGGMVVKPLGGGASRLLPGEFGHVAHGYVSTSHAAQGKTVDHVLIAQSAESFAASDREQFYVSASRGRRSVQLFTDDKAELSRRIAESGERVAASDIVREEKQRPKVHERVAARLFQAAREALAERWAALREDAERAGITVAGWPSRARAGPEIGR